jgi:hypothetical protein
MHVIMTTGGMELARTSNTGGPPRKLRSTSAHTWGVNKVAVDGQEQLQRVLLSQGGIKLAVSKSVVCDYVAAAGRGVEPRGLRWAIARVGCQPGLCMSDAFIHGTHVCASPATNS